MDGLTSDHRDDTALIGEIWSVRDPMVRGDLTDTAIRELVRHAVACDEEAQQFPELRPRIPREKLVELAAKVEAAKKLTSATA